MHDEDGDMNGTRRFLSTTVILLVTLLVARVALSTRQGSPATSPSEREAAMNSNVSVKVFNDKGELIGPISTPRVVKTDAEWQRQLTPEQYKIARNKGTEAPFCGTLLDNHQDGVYACVCCGLPLFSSDSKFNSGTGWPSFFQPVARENVIEHADDSLGMRRTEILCARCDCHLGHVFEDGPRPTGLRFCVNSDSLTFTPKDQRKALADPAAKNASPATQPAGR
jgi:methionine-R-sulfoxide reductase